MYRTPELIIVDGNWLMYRAYYASTQATSPMVTSKGMPTGAMSILVTMMTSMIKTNPGVPIIITFDAKGKNFRHEIFSEYKATRKPMPEDLVPQRKPISKLMKAMGFTVFEKEGVEADDVIGTLARMAYQLKWHVEIVTGDKDIAQLIRKRITLYNSLTKVRMDIKGVKKKYDLKPRQIIDYLALCGDSADNIPGIDGIGAKTAAKLLNEYGTVEGIIENGEEIKNTLGKKVRAATDMMLMCKDLTTIRTKIDLDFTKKDMKKLKQPMENTKKLHKMFKKYEMRQRPKGLMR